MIRADGGPIDGIRLNGMDYELEPLPKASQGKFSASYEISGGLLSVDGGSSRVPAILKVVLKDGSETKTEKEIEYLKRVSTLSPERNETNCLILIRLDCSWPVLQAEVRRFTSL